MWSGYSYIYDVFYVKTAVITVGDIMEHFEKNFYFLYEAVSLQKFVKKKNSRIPCGEIYSETWHSYSCTTSNLEANYRFDVYIWKCIVREMVWCKFQKNVGLISKERVYTLGI